MEVTFAVICQKALQDKETNTFSLINVIEEVGLPTEPPEGTLAESTQDLRGLSPGNFEMVIWWARTQEGTPERGRGRVRIDLPNGAPVKTAEMDVDLTSFLRLRSRLMFPGFPDGGEGTYRFIVEYGSGEDDWEPKFTYPIRVTVGTPTMPKPEQPSG